MTNTKPTIKEEHATVYTLRNIPEGGWADITLREWKEGGSFCCQSDFGEFAYIWGSIGPRSLRQFLCALDKDYFLKKTRPNDYRMFSVEQTCQEIRRQILEYRWERDIEKEDARLCWDQTHRIEKETDSSEGFYRCMEDLDIVSKVYHGDYLALPSCTKYSPICDLFWERVWPHITAYWREKEEK